MATGSSEAALPAVTVKVKTYEDPDSGESFSARFISDGVEVGNAEGVIVARDGSPGFFSSCDAHSGQLQHVSVIFCDDRGKSRHPALQALGPGVSKGGFLFIHKFSMTAAATGAAADRTAIGAAALRALLNSRRIAGKWTLAAYIPWTDESPGLSKEDDADQFFRSGFDELPDTATEGRHFLYATPSLIEAPPRASGSRVLRPEAPPPPPRSAPDEALHELMQAVMRDIAMGEGDENTRELKAMSAHVPRIKTLVRNGASIDRACALHIAASRGAVRLFEKLLSLTPDPVAAINATDENGITPLMVAAVFARGNTNAYYQPKVRPEFCAWMIAHGASTQAKDRKGHTARVHLLQADRSYNDMRLALGPHMPRIDCSELLTLLSTGLPPEDLVGCDESLEDDDAEYDSDEDSDVEGDEEDDEEEDAE